MRNSHCELGAESCKKTWLGQNSSTRFVADAERFTVMLDHTLRHPNGKTLFGAALPGYLHMAYDNPVARKLCKHKKSVVDPVSGEHSKTAPCYVAPQKAPRHGPDFFGLEELLAAAGISLDDTMSGGRPDTSGKKSMTHTHRQNGMVLLIMIEYHNTEDGRGLTKTRYVYKANALPQTVYATTDLIYTKYPNERRRVEKSGVLVEVQAAGQLGVFDFFHALTTLTMGLTLLAFISFFMSMVAQFCCTGRQFFARALNEDIRDLAAITDAISKNASSKHIMETLHENKLPTDGSKDRQIYRLYSLGFRWDPNAEKILRPTRSHS